jgi:hypothetical protein
MREFISIERAFKHASNDIARVKVLDQIADTFSASSDKTIAKFLAELTLTDSCSRDVRLVAYFVLYEVCDRRLANLPPAHEFMIPEHLDLAFLHLCMQT